MFPKMSLDLAILSIVDENPDGIKGYALMKELERRFGEDIAPGPGALYPRLDRLKKDGYLTMDENDKLWKVSPGGKKHLQEQAPDVLGQSLDFMPQLYKFLMKAIPFTRRLDFLADQAHPGECHSCGPRHGLFDSESIMHDLGDIPEEGKSIKRLQDIKERLGNIKKRTEEQLKAQLAAIDGVLKTIDDKIARCEAEKASWRRITIEDGSFGSKDT